MKHKGIIIGSLAICTATCFVSCKSNNTHIDSSTAQVDTAETTAATTRVQEPFWEMNESYKAIVTKTPAKELDEHRTVSYFKLLEVPSFLQNSVRKIQKKQLTAEQILNKWYKGEEGIEIEEWNLSADTFYQTGKYLTLKYLWSVYTKGAAHGLCGIYSAVFDKETGAQVNITDLIADTAQLNAIAFQCFKEQNWKIFANKDLQDIKELQEKFFVPDNFAVTPHGLEFYFELYDIVSYSEGLLSFTIPYNKLK
jgi:hypothetical protein